MMTNHGRSSVKLVIVGDPMTGKSKLIQRYLANAYDDGYDATKVQSYDTYVSLDQ